MSYNNLSPIDRLALAAMGYALAAEDARKSGAGEDTAFVAISRSVYEDALAEARQLIDTLAAAA